MKIVKVNELSKQTTDVTSHLNKKQVNIINELN